MKKALNKKLINTLIFVVILYFIFLMKEPLLRIIDIIFKTLLPFIIAFVMAYVFTPIVDYMKKKKITKPFSIILIILFIIILMGLFGYFILPIFFNQILLLMENINQLLTNLSNTFNINLSSIIDLLNPYILKFNTISNGEFINTLSLKTVSDIFSILLKIVICFISFVYFIWDMNKIKLGLKNYFEKNNKKIFLVLKNIDISMMSFIKGYLIFMVILFFEYTFLFLIIGHPNYLLLGFMVSITAIIPYFGGIFSYFIAIISALLVSPKLCILTIIITSIFPNIDGYITLPKILNKTNNIYPIFTIIITLLSSALFGVIGLFMGMPIVIILKSIFDVYGNPVKIEKKQK